MTLTIGVCIPCIESHIKHLENCIKSIYEQITFPDEVVISISSVVNKGTVDTVEIMLNKYRKRLNIRAIYTMEKKYAGENRNIALENCKSDIISFIDADDMMYPNRLYVLRNIFELYPWCIGILHHFNENSNKKINKGNFNEDFIEEYRYSEQLHYGHSSFRRILFNEFKYTNKPRGQDIEFVQRLLEKYINNLLVYKSKLTNYVSNNSTFYHI
jgi:glycosyltransferase involved in cell wall biosynthesis